MHPITLIKILTNLFKGDLMKIAHIAYQTWPTQAGSVSRLHKIIDAQKFAGKSIFIVSGPFQESVGEGRIEEHQGDKYYRYLGSNKGFSRKGGWLKRIKKFIDIFFFIPHLFRIIKNEDPDVIHAHATFVVGLASVVVGLLLRKPVVYEIRSTWEEDLIGGKGVWLQRKAVFLLERLTIKLCDLPVFISKGLVEHYVGAYKGETVIYNCMSDPEINKKIFSDNIVFGYLGTLAYYEGLEYLFEAVAKLRLDYKFEIRIAGSGDMANKYIQKVNELRIDDIVAFVGKIEPNKISSFYDVVDVIVLPRKDLLITNRVAGLKPVEAFAFKKLVISSDVGGMKELFEDNKHGLMFKAESVNALVEKMKFVLNKHDSIDEIVDNGYCHFKNNFTSTSMDASYTEVYEKLMP